PSGADRHHPSLGLGDDLLGDRQDVPVLQDDPGGANGRDQQAGEVVPGPNLGHPEDGVDLNRQLGSLPTAARTAASASRSLAWSSTMIVSVTSTRTPAPRTRGARSRSAWSMTHAPIRPLSA